MQIGMIGLGRMGANMSRRLMRGGHEVVAHDRSGEAVAALEKDGATAAHSLNELVKHCRAPRVICLMVPAGVVDGALASLLPLLSANDIVIDGGNSHYHDDIERARSLSLSGIHYIDMGTSGGVWGLERGYCLMIGGAREPVQRLDPIFRTLAPNSTAADTNAANRGTAHLGYLHCGPAGAGHFVKMIHNGIEYGLMAAYAEGMNILRHANIGTSTAEHDAETTPLRSPQHYQYDFKLDEIAEVWRHGSVISSWLLDLTASAFAGDPSLEKFGGRVSDSGEGRWALQAANDEGVPALVLAAALFERFASRDQDVFQNKVLSAMRFGFGGHEEKK
ncbi:MAG TPA: decarboxylating 6-phosphogluconate dehydrogenase [Vicinamibacterales bacterium]|nr:decarboxylating 6-phosphogluconate dehydrogenase [Vicinamibacterales bacterium]